MVFTIAPTLMHQVLDALMREPLSKGDLYSKFDLRCDADISYVMSNIRYLLGAPVQSTSEGYYISRGELFLRKGTFVVTEYGVGRVVFAREGWQAVRVRFQDESELVLKRGECSTIYGKQEARSQAVQGPQAGACCTQVLGLSLTGT